MKYAIVIPDGAADEPVDSLGGKTPLQAARMPNGDRVARLGAVGRTDNVPRPLTPASDVATLSLFGYDPLQAYTGRAPLEAAALGVMLGPADWAVRCNLVHIENEEMRDFTAGHISSDEGRQIIGTLKKELIRMELVDQHGNVVSPVTLPLDFYAGVGYRHLMVIRGQDFPALGDDLITQPPHDIPDQPIQNHLPKGTGADLLRFLMDQSRFELKDHPVNKARRAAGQRDVTQIWLWGYGKAPQLTSFVELYGKRGAITTGVDLVRGVGTLLGWDRLEAPGVTDYLDNDYAAQGRLAVEALAKYDLVCVHVEAPDEASHEGKADEKIKALERIDEHIIGPLLEALPKHGDWRILIAPDHRTPLKTRAHSYGAVPFAVAGAGVPSRGQSSYDEATAAASDLSFDPGYGLMRWFLGNGNGANRT